ncbi:MAG: hypothetical protein K1000chlam3_01681, partial [Chlamydiae bacterium]|nr:hypothetical protein [Chlamydiota bacterium]
APTSWDVSFEVRTIELNSIFIVCFSFVFKAIKPYYFRQFLLGGLNDNNSEFLFFSC